MENSIDIYRVVDLQERGHGEELPSLLTTFDYEEARKFKDNYETENNIEEGWRIHVESSEIAITGWE